MLALCDLGRRHEAFERRETLHRCTELTYLQRTDTDRRSRQLHALDVCAAHGSS